MGTGQGVAEEKLCAGVVVRECQSRSREVWRDGASRTGSAQQVVEPPPAMSGQCAGQCERARVVPCCGRGSWTCGCTLLYSVPPREGNMS